ncbi:MAG: SMI1/KNR4 family protein [Gammaproteobacteria bacterium]|nr:MAG: SMI1/KNR4 family protein [Gammaproteobacteria bacterium]
MKHYYFERELLPDNFSFPQTYIEFISHENIPDLEPWWFLCENEEFAKFWMEEIAKQYPSRKLVPFAKIEDTDDVACFDGSDTSGDPKIYYVHTFAAPGWEDRGEVENFATWLEKTEADSAQYKADMVIEN